MTKRHGLLGLASLAFLLSLFLAACGSREGTVEGQVLGMYNTTDQPKILQGATILIAGSKGDRPPITTGGDGHFKVSLPYDNYNIEASYPGLQARQKTFAIDSDKTESAGFVLVADGIAEPTSPPPPPPNPQQYGRAESVATDPWFWFWMFDRPYYYGYSRPAWVSYGSPSSTVIVIDRKTDPAVASNNRGYVAYSDPQRPQPGTKAAPVAQTVATGSKGASKPGTGGSSASNAAPVSPPSSGNKGSAGGSSAGSSAGTQTKPVAPPAAAPPSSGGSRGSAPSGGGSKGRR